MSKKYAVTINRWDENAEASELLDQWISADQAIDLMIYIQQNIEAVEEGEEDDEDESEHVRNGRKGGARVGQIRKCSACGKPGHTYRTCTKKSSASSEPAGDEDHYSPPARPSPTQTDNRSLRERVQELWEGGLDIEEVFDSLPSEPMAEISAIYHDLDRKRR